MTHPAHRIVDDPFRHPSTARRIAAAAGMLIAVAFTAVLGALTNAPHTDGWYAEVEKVPWSPPNALFGPVWSILYLMIAVAGYLLWRRGFRGVGVESGTRGLLMLFVAQLVLNALWSPVFFAGYAVFGVAAWWVAMVIMVVLIVLVISLIAGAARSVPAASWLLLPYLAWLIFASTLNAGVIALN